MFILKSAVHSMAKADTSESFQQGNSEDNRRRFAALLRPATSDADHDILQSPSPAFASSPCAKAPIAMATRPGDMLHLRLTNGPCAGLEIEATERNGQLHVRLIASNAEQLEHTLRGRRRVETELNTIFGRPITLEFSHAASPN